MTTTPYPAHDPALVDPNDEFTAYCDVCDEPFDSLDAYTFTDDDGIWCLCPGCHSKGRPQ